MKVAVLTTTISLLVLVGWGEATGEALLPPPFDINNIIPPGRCEGPDIPTVALFVDPDGKIRPVPSRYAFHFRRRRMPTAVQIQLLNQIGGRFNREGQSIAPRTGRVEVDVVCDEAEVMANEERLTFLDFMPLLERRYIDEGLGPDVNPDLFIHSDRQDAYNRTLEAINCRVDVDWLDAGELFFPRYYASGFCRPRRCSLPDRSNFLCRADLTNPLQMSHIYINQYDCCWAIIRNGRSVERKLECGWRLVRIPIVCDCDCECGAEEILPV